MKTVRTTQLSADLRQCRIDRRQEAAECDEAVLLNAACQRAVRLGLIEILIRGQSSALDRANAYAPADSVCASSALPFLSSLVSVALIKRRLLRPCPPAEFATPVGGPPLLASSPVADCRP